MSSSSSLTSSSKIYHENQHWQRCAIHACNNLFQESVHTKETFDEICKTLSPDAWVNPHKSIWGTGNYDANVLILAIEKRPFSVKWHDRRKSIDLIDLNELAGIVVNEKSSKLFGLTSSFHWFCLKQIGDKNEWFNLDSKLDGPQKLSVADVKKLLTSINKEKDNNILLVYPSPSQPSSTSSCSSSSTYSFSSLSSSSSSSLSSSSSSSFSSSASTVSSLSTSTASSSVSNSVVDDLSKQMDTLSISSKGAS
eukprot:TRINITY_DN1112_c0_g2_i2.p1 TRINITY_DN1112_c0_g2~~TRINITY_DN1112_c0_g2_i2.p1  ORF type:complete len:252 (-),score=68.75 TRINITY_DN1112_c0_g2_i2:189-944(-)